MTSDFRENPVIGLDNILFLSKADPACKATISPSLVVYKYKLLQSLNLFAS